MDITFTSVTLFVGPQGSGKSTLAKLYSMFLWIEKRLLRGMLSVAALEEGNRFQESYCAYHRLNDYFRDGSTIRFEGLAFDFCYSKGSLKVTERSQESLIAVPKVMYVPAERNFLGSLSNLSGLKSLPPSLQAFKEEYEEACIALARGFRLPIARTSFVYDITAHTAWLVGRDYKVRLTDASSGFQAVLPLLLVTQHLTDVVAKLQEHANGLNIGELSRLKQEVARLMANENITSEVREAALASLSARFAYSGFVNVVEEPEENLYPESQKHVLFRLLSLANVEKSNSLVMTTHSPYIVNYLTLAVKASELLHKGASPEEIDATVPSDSTVAADKVSIYELADGTAHRLSMDNGVPSDLNVLNNALADANVIFDELLDIEDSLPNG